MSMYSIEEIRELVKMVSEYKLEKLKIESGDDELTIVGHSAPPMPPFAPQAMSMPQVVATPQTMPADAPAAPAAPEAPKGILVKAPIVGTFYAASAPDQPPFVKVGDTVKKGDVLFIIESMKLMNEVQSEVDGVVTEILVSNAEAVEFDQPILRVE